MNTTYEFTTYDLRTINLYVRDWAKQRTFCLSVTRLFLTTVNK